MRRNVIHYLPEPDNGKVACGLDVLKVQYHAYSRQGTTCKRCKVAERFLKEDWPEVCEGDSKVKFKDLLKKYDWKDIRTVILALYPDQEKSIDGYELVLKELLILKPTKTKMCIVIEDEFDEDEQKRYHDVSAKDETKNKWAFDFIDWAECLNMEIDSKTFSKYSPIDIVVHCLWEMTWYGFTRKEVNKKADKLAKAVRIA